MQARGHIGLTGEQCAGKVGGAVTTAHTGADAHDGHLDGRFNIVKRCGLRGRPRASHRTTHTTHSALRLRFSQRFDNQMGIVAPKTKCADARALWPRPGLGLVQQAKRRACQSLVGLVHMQSGRFLAVRHGSQHLDEPGNPGSGDQVPQVGFERANRHIRTPGKHPRHAAQFGGITHGRAGGVAFQQANVSRAQTRLGIGHAQSAFLAFFRRGQQSAPAPVVGQTHAANHTQHRAPSGQCV